VYLERLLANPNGTLPRVLVRAAECALLSQVDFPRPLLDVGSGDGSFAQALFEEPLDVGIDNSRPQMVRSLALDMYRNLAQCSAVELPFRDGSFGSVMSNSTLEHIPDAAGVLKEMARLLRRNGVCAITVPSEHFPEYLLGTTVLSNLRIRKAADAYGRFMNRISRHIHVERPDVWRGWLEDAGFEVVEWRYYFSRRDTMLLDLSHYVSIPSMLTRAALGRWVLWPGKTRYLPYRAALSPFASPGPVDKGAYIFFRCRRT
jgi:SAM-dependent methyltransferase